MPDIVTRLAVLVLVSLAIMLLISSGRRFVEVKRQQALATSSPFVISNSSNIETRPDSSHVQILAFSSADCRECHRLQAPALKRVMEARGTSVSVVEVDAPSQPELTQRYRVLTVPTTVVLDTIGRAHAVNYGFANTSKLLEQVDKVLAQVSA